MSTVDTAPEVEELVRATLARHRSLFLATCGAAGPWASGVYFAEDGLFELAIVLERRGRTLAAIRDNPAVAVVVSSGSPAQPFLQAQATARVVEGDEGERVRAALVAKVPEAAPFLGTPIEALRLAVPEWRVTDLPRGWLPGKQLTR